MLNAIYPIGHIYHSGVSTNPATLLGMPASTWSQIASGRVLVGIDSGDADFDTIAETGGAKTHGHSDNLSHDNNHSGGGVDAHAGGAITTNHPGGAGTTEHAFSGGSNHSGAALTHTNNHTGTHTHDDSASIGVTAGADGTAWNAANASTGPSANPTAHGDHTGPSAHALTDHAAHGFTQPNAHVFTQPTGHSNHGSHVAVSQMNPYYVCYIWERTA